MKVCPSCQDNKDDNAVYCSSCGSFLSTRESVNTEESIAGESFKYLVITFVFFMMFTRIISGLAFPSFIFFIMVNIVVNLVLLMKS